MGDCRRGGAAAICWAGVASAKPSQTTKYTYYTIGGDTAVEIYNSMMKKGPKVNGAKAYAATSATTTQDGKLLQGSSCQVEDYRLKLDFVIKLPKIKNEKVLPAADRKRWQQFSGFLKTHEETHRKIWLGLRGRPRAAGEIHQGQVLRRGGPEGHPAVGQDPRRLQQEACGLRCRRAEAADDSTPSCKLVYKRSTASARRRRAE